MRALLRNPWLTIVASLVLGGFFVYASLHKIAEPPDFSKTVLNYKLVPWYLINIVAIYMPWFELIAGLAVALPALLYLLPRALSGSGASSQTDKAQPLAATACLRHGGALGLSLLALVFIAAIGYNLHRGHPTFCGCFSTFEGVGKHMTDADKFWQMKREIFVNAGLILLALQVLCGGQGQRSSSHSSAVSREGPQLG